MADRELCAVCRRSPATGEIEGLPICDPCEVALNAEWEDAVLSDSGGDAE